MRVIIAGGRYFNDYEMMKKRLDFFFSLVKDDDLEGIEIVSGKAQGADTLGERYARENGYPIKEFYAQWGQYGRRAGFLRNQEMAEYATHCICFWDGESKGTKHMIDLAKSHGLGFRLVSY
jgi:hypothetical protein